MFFAATLIISQILCTSNEKKFLRNNACSISNNIASDDSDDGKTFVCHKANDNKSCNTQRITSYEQPRHHCCNPYPPVSIDSTIKNIMNPLFEQGAEKLANSILSSLCAKDPSNTFVYPIRQPGNGNQPPNASQGNILANGNVTNLVFNYNSPANGTGTGTVTPGDGTTIPANILALVQTLLNTLNGLDLPTLIGNLQTLLATLPVGNALTPLLTTVVNLLNGLLGTTTPAA
ncbi:hypothetical protein COBT_000331 [Conglomerata obtusa]